MSQQESIKSVSNVSLDSLDVYILDNGIKKPLHYETVKKYIASICQKMKVQHLDIDKITNNVYPKLKTVNTVQEVEDVIVMSTSEINYNIL